MSTAITSPAWRAAPGNIEYKQYDLPGGESYQVGMDKRNNKWYWYVNYCKQGPFNSIQEARSDIESKLK